MAEVICDTSPIQYLHRLGALHLLPALLGSVVIPQAVADELAIGRSLGVDLPDLVTLDWVAVRTPTSASVLPLVTGLGAGETQVLALALETTNALVILDDGLARRTAESLAIPLKGTLGILLDAKRAGLITAVAPFLDQLHSLRFHLSSQTQTAVLKLAGETS